MKKKLVLTGSNGFLGSYVAKTFDTSLFDIYYFDRTKHSLTDPKSLSELFSGAEIIIHLAGANRDTAVTILSVNTVGTLGVLEAMKTYCPVAKLIYSSSFQVYGPPNIYSYSKKYAEELIEYYTNTSQISAIVLRIANLYGKGSKPFYNTVIATFAELINTGKTLEISGDGEQKKDFIHVSDVAEAIKKCALYVPKQKTEYFDICTGKTIALNEIISIFKKVSGKDIYVRYKNQDKKNDPDIIKDYNDAEEKLGWSPEKNIEDGLKEMIT